MKPALLIFLDFDGVLHPIHAADTGQFCHMERFLELLDDFARMRVVISSSWRHQMNPGTLQSLFGRHSGKVIGATGDIPKPKDGFWRLHEILHWIQDNKYHGPWLAIDDAAHEFPEDHPNLFLCESGTGLDDEAIEALRRRIGP